MSADKQPKAAADAQAITRGPLPGSKKIYVAGRQYPDLNVPMREVALSPTRSRRSDIPNKSNPPITLYDTSGPYTDPQAQINLRQGLQPIRSDWICDRKDTDELPEPSSPYSRQQCHPRDGIYCHP